MSLVIAIKNDGGNYILGADSQVTYGNLMFHNSSKLHKFEKLNIVIGTVGDLRFSNLIKNNEDLFKDLIKDDKIDKKYLMTEFTKKLCTYLKEYYNDAIRKDDNGTDESVMKRNAFIIAHKDEAFYVFGDYSILEINGVGAIGCADEFALGCIESMLIFSKLDISRIIQETIKMASRIIDGVDSNWNIIEC